MNLDAINKNGENKMASATPKVTVLMSVYNGERYLHQAMDSVLQQSFDSFEFLIIDDGSADNSIHILQSYQDTRIRIIKNESNLGLIRSLNRGLEAATGQYIARHDCDDILEPDRLERQVSYLETHPDVVLVGSWVQLIDENGDDLFLWKYPASDIEIRWASLFNTAVSHPSSMYRTEAARKAGGYSPDFIYAEDYDLWSRLAGQGKIANIPSPLQRYRVHNGSVSTKHDAKQMDTRLAIAARNIRAISQDSLSSAMVQFVVQYSLPTTTQELLDTIEGYRILFEQFQTHYQLSPMESEKIRSDIIERLATTFQNVGWQVRLTCLIRRFNFFPLGFWVRGQFLSLLLNESIKQFGRQLLRRQRTHILRN